MRLQAKSRNPSGSGICHKQNIKSLNEAYTENTVKYGRKNRRRRHPLSFRVWLAMAIAGALVANITYYILAN